MARAVTRLTSKLEAKLADKDFYEAHQLYRTIYFRLERDIKYSALTCVEDGSPKERFSVLLRNRWAFVEGNASYPFLLEFLSDGVETLLRAKEIISSMDLLKLLRTQFSKILFDQDVKPGSEAAEFDHADLVATRNAYYGFLQRWFARFMDLLQLFCETGLEMIQNKSAQSKGFQENDFVSERDLLMYNYMGDSKCLRVFNAEDAVDQNIRNAFIRSYGLPELHLRNGKLLMRFQEMAKARVYFLYGQDSFELAKFLFFFHRAHHNTATEYELVLVRTLLKVLNTQLFINAKPGMYRGQRGEKFKRLKIGRFTDEETAQTKVRTLTFAKEVFYYYLAITRFFALKEDVDAQRSKEAVGSFKQMFLLKYFHFYLILLEELLRQEDTVPAESFHHFLTKFAQQMRKNFKFHDEICFATDRDAERFLNFFGSRRDYAESLADAVTGDNAKLYLLKLFYELRTNIYKPTITFYRKVDRELDIDLMDRIFFVYYNDTVPQTFADIRDELDSPGYFEPAQSRQSQQPPNLFSMLLGGMAGGSSGGIGGGGGGNDADNFMSFLNDFMN